MILDKHNANYREIQKYVEGQLARHRKLLETVGTPEEKTRELRGRIDELKKLLAFNGDETNG